MRVSSQIVIAPPLSGLCALYFLTICRTFFFPALDWVCFTFFISAKNICYSIICFWCTFSVATVFDKIINFSVLCMTSSIGDRLSAILNLAEFGAWRCYAPSNSIDTLLFTCDYTPVRWSKFCEYKCIWKSSR